MEDFKELLELTRDALAKYYTRLGNIGVNYNEDSLIVLLFIQQMLTTQLANYITDKDYNIIMAALSCLYDSNCLIGRNVPECKNFVYFTDEFNIDMYNDDKPRETEWDQTRIDTDGTVRKKTTANYGDI